MKTILLSNIGNRNIKYKGETFNFKEHGKDFKTQTKNLLDNFPIEKKFLEINIINDLLALFTAGFKLSVTIAAGTPPNASKHEPKQPKKSGLCWLALAISKVQPLQAKIPTKNSTAINSLV